jgi:chitodextrinase
LALVGLNSPVNAQAPPPAAFNVPIIGEIERLTLDNPADVWSGGTIVVGGQNVVLPRNLLIDLPANRLTLQQLFVQAPSACSSRGESGIAKADTCNALHTGGQAAITATRTIGGNVIAADVYFQKGIESVTGVVTYINYTDGYFRMNGNPNDATTGVMVRLNDPTGVHTVQQGSGCVAGSPNCSPDPRFTEDPQNYTQAYGTGYPVCLPSTVARQFTDTLDLNGNGSKTDLLTAVSTATGTGDLLCPDTNRSIPVAPASGLQVDAAIQLVADSRRFAPIQMGDHLTAKGNFETINNVRFLSSWGTAVTGRLETREVAGQPDYMTINEMFIAAPGFQDQRARSTIIGRTSLDSTSATGVNGSDVLLWTTHHDPGTNAVHEFPFGSVRGCDTAAGRGRCTFNEGGPNSWIVKYIVGFRTPAPFARAPELSACGVVRSEPRFSVPGRTLCPSASAGGDPSLEDEFTIFSPITHELQARTGRKVADMAAVGGPTLFSIDVRGNNAANGQYLFPMGINLGGIDPTELGELNVGLIGRALNLSGIPWNLDRRLSPGGCIGPCESTPQPLDPFPFEGASVDPRLQALNFVVLGAGLPTGPVTDLNFTNTTLTNASNRIFSFVSPALGIFDGDNTLLAWPPVDPAGTPITPTNIFSAIAACDTVAPAAPTGLTATAASATSITLTFTPGADNVGVTGFKVFVDGGAFPIATATASSITVGGFAPSTAHTFIVQGIDAAGNLSAPSNAATATTLADTTAPTTPSGLLATASGQNVINLTWTVSTDNVKVTGYRVFRDGVLAATVTGTAVSDTGLAPASTHSYTVAAIDAANNQSGLSNTATATTATPPANDTVAPSVPTGLIATGSSPSTIDLSWNASTDNVGVTGYKVYRDGAAVEVATVTTGTSYSDTGLTTGTAHTYTVAAFDAANNLSAKSTSASATTQSNVILVSMTLNPLTVATPNPSTGTITLNGTAPAGGVAIALTSSNTQKATVPAAIVVPAGQTTVTFQVSTAGAKLGGGSNPVNITASFAGVNKVVTLNVTR